MFLELINGLFIFSIKLFIHFLIYNTDHPLAEDRNGGLFTGATPPLATRIGFYPLILKQNNNVHILQCSKKNKKR
jgi:hypothetical protein